MLASGQRRDLSDEWVLETQNGREQASSCMMYGRVREDTRKWERKSDRVCSLYMSLPRQHLEKSEINIPKVAIVTYIFPNPEYLSRF